MYLGYQNGKIRFYTENELDPVLYCLEKSVKTNKKYVVYGGEYVLYDDDVKAKILQDTKEAKYQEALEGAKSYIENKALYRYDDNTTIEATDGNIGKFSAYALALLSGRANSATWTSKEDNALSLNLEDVTKILMGLGAVQADIWNVQFLAYKNEIENAETKEDVEKIEIIYNSEGISANTAETTATNTVSNEVEAAGSKSTAE